MTSLSKLFDNLKLVHVHICFSVKSCHEERTCHVQKLCHMLYKRIQDSQLAFVKPRAWQTQGLMIIVEMST